MSLPSGKIPVDLLKQIVFKNLGAKRNEVVLGPSAGIDGAVLDLGNKSLIVSMDPITGALERIGWLSVNVNANDIATFGVEPQFMLSCIILPENADRKTVETISVQMGQAARKLGIAIVGGHCETTPGLASPIVVGCVMGFTEKGNYVTAGGAQPQDMLILTKTAGIEGTAILATDRETKLKKTIKPKVLKKAKTYFSRISVVKEATEAFKMGGVHAMHDPTEGGIIGGVTEMAEASKLGVEIHENRVPITPETASICKHFNIDPLRLISSGALLIASDQTAAPKIIDHLKQRHVRASVVGNFLENPKKRTLIRKNGTTEDLPKFVSDHLWIALSRTSN
jgi:hydrogenase expression/formation protein HypE